MSPEAPRATTPNSMSENNCFPKHTASKLNLTFPEKQFLRAHCVTTSIEVSRKPTPRGHCITTPTEWCGQARSQSSLYTKSKYVLRKTISQGSCRTNSNGWCSKARFSTPRSINCHAMGALTNTTSKSYALRVRD